jgi:hypothetical protein
MIKANWDIFRKKFSENPQGNFEWLCYLLFCKEFNKPFGIFRFKNQSAIEAHKQACWSACADNFFFQYYETILVE